MVQGALTIALQAFAGFRGTTAAQLRAWLIRIVHNYVSHCFAKARAARTSLEDVQEPLDTRHDQSVAEFWDSLNLLAIEDQEIIILRHFEGWEYAELAENLGLTEEALRKRYSRALERLRDLIGDEE